tara:strand:+ start:139 stop:336 length:198 start_codon:yes stop_codon:yes gene_type:complete
MVKLNPNRIERKSHTIVKKNQQHNQTWEWDETPELRDFISRQNNQPELKAPNPPKDNEVPKLATS